MIQLTRVKALLSKPVKHKKYVLYWMQSAQRVECNHALEFSVQQANNLNQPLIVGFGLTDDYPEANERHYYFMLQGIKHVKSKLNSYGIKMIILKESPDKSAIELSKDASILVTDEGYTRIQRLWRENVYNAIDCAFYEITTNAIIPISEASKKEEYSAGTFRKKVNKVLDEYLISLNNTKPNINSLNIDFRFFKNEIKEIDPDKIIKEMKIDKSVKSLNWIKGGANEGKEKLEEFINNKLFGFAQYRNDPTKNFLSNMSPYLHFGQVSPLYIALKIKENIDKINKDSIDSYLEELIIRRELSINFVAYNRNYNNIKCLPKWAYNSLYEASKDEREYIYELDSFESAKTHDTYWNAAQKELLTKGKIHGYMRMYWGKKILEWTKNPSEAFQIALYLNNKYSLDGRDPNGYAGIAWIFGKHDRAWKNRPIFGKVRYMNAKGLERKFNISEYVNKVNKYY